MAVIDSPVIIGVRRPEPWEIRYWAATHGYDVSDRGRLPSEVIEDHAIAVAEAISEFYLDPHKVL